jgi:hypothetical protein
MRATPVGMHILVIHRCDSTHWIAFEIPTFIKEAKRYSWMKKSSCRFRVSTKLCGPAARTCRRRRCFIVVGVKVRCTPKQAQGWHEVEKLGLNPTKLLEVYNHHVHKGPRDERGHQSHRDNGRFQQSFWSSIDEKLDLIRSPKLKV